MAADPDAGSVAPEGIFLWGGPLPSSASACRRVNAYRDRSDDNYVVRIVKCGDEHFIFLFFSGLEVVFKQKEKEVCSFLNDHLRRVLQFSNTRDAKFDWWTQRPTDQVELTSKCKVNSARP
jgi:hypothetical protein